MRKSSKLEVGYELLGAGIEEVVVLLLRNDLSSSIRAVLFMELPAIIKLVI